MRAIDRWRRLSVNDRTLVVRVAPVVAAATARLHLLGIRNALAWADTPIGAPAATLPDDLARACARAARYIPRATCLARSLALARVLRKKGVAAKVGIGVETDPHFAAHAWVEVDGVPLADAPARYTPLTVR